jgi:hydroxypyruvate reductase
MRDDLIRIFRAGVARAAPGPAVTAAMPGARPDLILALGKAACAMAEAALARHPGVPALVVTNGENARDLPGAEVMVGGHPVPDAGSAAAGAALLARAEALGGGELLCLISGGGSALAVAPVAGLTLADKAAATRAMLGGGLDIEAMNLVRQQLSRIKGGGLARAAAPARVTALILSDVVGDALAAIASGPVSPPLGTPWAARDVLARAGLWDGMPAPVREALSRPPAPPPPEAACRIVGSNRMSVEAMAHAAPRARVEAAPLVGDVAEAAARVARAARSGPGTTLWGGETTVVLRGDGLGGRNQELALRVALRLEGLGVPWAFLAGGTDGRDGPTDAAGAVVGGGPEGGTVARIRAAGIDPRAALARNDSHPALDAAGDLLRIGGTGTNVADLAILRVGPSSGA